MYEPDRFGLHAAGELATARHRGPVPAATAPIRRTPVGGAPGPIVLAPVESVKWRSRLVVEMAWIGRRRR